MNSFAKLLCWSWVIISTILSMVAFVGINGWVTTTFMHNNLWLIMSLLLLMFLWLIIAVVFTIASKLMSRPNRGIDKALTIQIVISLFIVTICAVSMFVR